MLSELYQYALDHQLITRPGFKPKNPKAYILLSRSGEFVGINLRDKDANAVMAPDIGSAAQGTLYCNILIEKAKYPLGITDGGKDAASVRTKRGHYLEVLEDGSEAEPRLLVLKEALENEKTVRLISDAMEQHKLKSGDIIGFQVDGAPLEKSEAFGVWWSDYRKRYAKSSPKNENLPRCMITGELAPAMNTIPKVSGLIGVGGHSSGDAFLSFDKDAFQSYGLKQSANAPVSEEAITAVNSALTELIRVAPTIGGAKIVHWYSEEINSDPVQFIIDPDIEFDDDDEEEETDTKEQEHAAIRESRKLLSAVRQGVTSNGITAHYYIMPLSGVNGRMMVRGWYEGSFEELRRNVDAWFEDLSLTTWNGRGMAGNPKLFTLYIRLLKPGGDPLKVYERTSKELQGLSSRILYSVVKGLPLPNEIPVRVMHWLRSEMLTGDSNGKGAGKGRSIEYETAAFQLLKAWLRREQKRKGETNLMEAEENPKVERDTAYYCGQLMAIYTAIQRSAMPEVGVGLAQRYFTSASSNPAFVIGRLAQLSQHHLAKLEGGLAVYYERMLAETYDKIGGRSIPAALNAQQQSEFALGYYQKRANMYRKQESNVQEAEGEAVTEAKEL